MTERLKSCDPWQVFPLICTADAADKQQHKRKQHLRKRRAYMDKNEELKKASTKAKGFIAEFKEFVSRGNVMDMAVGIIIGSAFTAIVNSLVNDILMPLISCLVGDLDFSEWKLVLKPAVGEAEAITLAYGSFIQQIINFLLIALVIFIMIKAINSLHRKKDEAPAEEAPAKPSDEVVLLTEIRDLLKSQN